MLVRAFEMNNIKIIKADKSHIPQMAELITQNLGTCNLMKGANNDVMARNIAELTDTVDYYRVAIDDNGTVVGLCGIGEVKSDNDYALDIGKHRDVLYVVVSQDYQRQGIGTMLLKSCLRDIHDYPVIYEAWGEIKNGDVNSYKMLAKCSFELLADMGTSFYRNHGYCPYCVNKGKNCRACFCKIYIHE